MVYSLGPGLQKYSPASAACQSAVSGQDEYGARTLAHPMNSLKNKKIGFRYFRCLLVPCYSPSILGRRRMPLQQIHHVCHAMRVFFLAHLRPTQIAPEHHGSINKPSSLGIQSRTMLQDCRNKHCEAGSGKGVSALLEGST